MVNLDIERFGVFLADCSALKVVGKPWECRCGNKTENRFRDRADAVRRNDVALKRSPAGAIRIAGERIVNDLRRRERERRAQVTVSESHRWNARSGYISATVADSLIVSE